MITKQAIGIVLGLCLLHIAKGHTQEIIANSGFDIATGVVQFINTLPGETFDAQTFRDWKPGVMGAGSNAIFSVIDDSTAPSARNVMRIKRIAGNECHLDKLNLFRLEDGHVYKISYWGRSSGDGALTKINIPLYTWDNRFITSGPEIWYNMSTQWEKVEKTFVAAVEHETIGKASLRLAQEAIGMEAEYDDVEINDVSYTNRNVNGGFENSDEKCLFWQNYAGGADQGAAYIVQDGSEGRNALRLVRLAATGGDANISQDDPNYRLPWLGNHDVRVTLSIKDDPSLSSGEYVMVKVAAFDKSGAFIKVPTNLSRVLKGGTNQYVTYNFQSNGDMPSNTAFISLSMRIVSAQDIPISGDVLIDNIAVKDLFPVLTDYNVNGGFEASDTEPSNWVNFAGGADQGYATIAHDTSEGRNSLRLVRRAAAGGDANLSQDASKIPWPGDHDIRLSFDLKDDPTMVRGECLRVRISAFDIAGNYIATPASLDQIIRSGSAGYIGNIIKSKGDIPANTAAISMSMQITNENGQPVAGDLLVDKIRLEDMSPLPSFTWSDKWSITYYYMWFTKDSFAGLDSDKGDAMLDIHPLLGPYNSTDEKIISSHIGMAQKGLIDAFAVSFDPTKTGEKSKLSIVFRKSMERNFRSCINLEAEGLTNIQILDGLRYYIGEYRRNPVCLRLGGLPVIYIWGTWKHAPDEWQQFFSQLHSEGYDAVYFPSNQTNESYLGPIRGLEEYVLVDINDSQLPSRYTSLRNKVSTYNGLHASTPAQWTATIMPGFDERLIPNRQPPLGWKDRNNGNYYQMTINAALNSHPEQIHVSTWNEFAEHSHVEPTEEEGYRYIDLTSDCIRQLTPRRISGSYEIMLPMTKAKEWRAYQ